MLLASLDALRVAVTIFDAHGRLLHANAHLNYLLHSLPPHETLIGRSDTPRQRRNRVKAAAAQAAAITQQEQEARSAIYVKIE